MPDLRAAIRQRHEPGLQRLRLPADGSDPRSQCQAFECLMERNGNQQYDLLAADRDGKRHTDENAVEEDPTLEQHALNGELFAFLLCLDLFQSIIAETALWALRAVAAKRARYLLGCEAFGVVLPAGSCAPELRNSLCCGQSAKMHCPEL